MERKPDRKYEGESSPEEVPSPQEEKERETPQEQGADTDPAQLRQKIEEYERRLLRLQADFDNYRKRMAKEQSRWSEDARLELVGSLLPVVDNLERALGQEGDGESIRQGVEMIQRQLLEVLAKYGVQPIAASGQPFDPNFHEAVMTEESGEHPEGTVLEEFRTGYALGSRLIRPCVVKVARCPQEDESQGKEADDK